MDVFSSRLNLWFWVLQMASSNVPKVSDDDIFDQEADEDDLVKGQWKKVEEARLKVRLILPA